MPRGKDWDSDGALGGPSSMDVLLEWLMAAGNAKRLQRSPARRGGLRAAIVNRIHDLFLRRGVDHRSRQAIRCKLWELSKQFDEAEEWLKSRGFDHYDVNETTKRAVMKICPYYPEIALSLGFSRFSRDTTLQTHVETNDTSDDSECEDSDDEIDASSEHFDNPRRSWSKPQRNFHFMNAKWDSDGVDGGPSSLSVLLKWIVTPGNAARWQNAARKADGSRLVLVGEIYDLLLTHGITHRSHGGVDRKLYSLEQQFDKAENWLKSKGLRHYEDTREAERTVLQMCPVYSDIKLLLQHVRPSTVATRSQTSQSVGVDTRFRQVAHDPVAARLSRPRRIHIDHHWRSSQRVNAKDTGGVSVLEADPQERREFFELELQIKRDEAICVRAKVRKELLDMGVVREDVDRLLPL